MADANQIEILSFSWSSTGPGTFDVQLLATISGLQSYAFEGEVAGPGVARALAQIYTRTVDRPDADFVTVSWYGDTFTYAYYGGSTGGSALAVDGGGLFVLWQDAANNTGGSLPTESITLNFEKVTLTYDTANRSSSVEADFGEGSLALEAQDVPLGQIIAIARRYFGEEDAAASGVDDFIWSIDMQSGSSGTTTAEVNVQDGVSFDQTTTLSWTGLAEAFDALDALIFMLPEPGDEVLL